MSAPDEHLRMAEALLFAASKPLDDKSLLARLPDGIDLSAVLAELAERYAGRGVNLVHIGGRWSFRTAADLRHVLDQHITQPRRLSRAAVETMAIIAYHQPVTRAEIEEIRGVAASKGTLDTLFEAGWIRPRGRRRTPGRPVTYGTTGDFLEHFGLETLSALPGLDELKATGLLRSQPPAPLLREAEERARREAVEAGDEVEAADSVVPLKRPQA